MKTDFLQFLGVFLIVVPADVAPPGGLVALSLVAMIGLCLLVSTVVLVSVLAIRAIREKNTPKDGS